MTVLRIVPNIDTKEPAKLRAFYTGLFGLSVVMDMGWVVTLASETGTKPQISFAEQGGADTPVPDLSIEVDNLEEVLQRAHDAGIAIEYGPVEEDWGVARFFIRDPAGRLLNILTHKQPEP